MKVPSMSLCGLNRLIKPSNPKIEIELNNSKQTYTTWDKVRGTVIVSVENEFLFSDINITLEALLQPVTATRELPASHTFLKLRQPIDRARYPASRTLVPGESYKFPFCFVIPTELPLGSCTHQTKDSLIQRTHGKLPPTLCLGTLSQNLCQISYSICVSISRPDGQTTGALTTARKVNVVPSDMERAFYSSSEDRSVSTYRAEQEVKSWKAPPLGRLTVEVSQPSHGGSLECCTNNEISTSIMLQLRFDPRGKSQPPQLRTLQPTLKAVTTLTTRPETTHLAADNIVTDAQYQGTSVQEISLPPVDISSAQWVKHSACESSSTPQPITSHTGTSYTASIAVPIILQKSSKLLPTFHSCLVSRIYRLELRACYQMSDTAILHRFVKLDMPIQLNNLQDSNRLNHSPSVSPAPCDNTKQWRIQACTQRQTDTLPSYLDSITK